MGTLHASIQDGSIQWSKREKHSSGFSSNGRTESYKALHAKD